MANFNVATMEFKKRFYLMFENDFKISVIGLGYVGLPVAVAFKKKNFEVIGYDINKDRIEKLKKHVDETGEVSSKDLKKTNIFATIWLWRLQN